MRWAWVGRVRRAGLEGQCPPEIDRVSRSEPPAATRWCEARLHGCLVRAEGTMVATGVPDQGCCALPGQRMSLAVCRSCRRLLRGNRELQQAVVGRRGRVSRRS